MISTTQPGNKHFSLITDYWRSHSGIRLAACLFSVIFIAQVLWIYPAQRQFEKDELYRLSQTGLAIMESLLVVAASDVSPEELKILGQTLTHKTPLKGARIYTYTGDLLLEFGEVPMYEPYQLRQVWHHWMTPRFDEGKRVEMAWLPQDSYSPYLIVSRLDSSYVQASIDRFIAFLLKMVFTVTFVSTLLLMWLLQKPHLRTWVVKVTGVDELKPSNKVR
jgi:hypothetical protein